MSTRSADRVCPTCKGTGWKNRRRCPDCGPVGEDAVAADIDEFM